MNKEAVKALYIETVKKLNLVPMDVKLTAGAALVMYGDREETDDLDIDIPITAFYRLLNAGYNYDMFGDVQVIHFLEKVDLHIGKYLGHEVIEGCCVHTVDNLIEQKKVLAKLPFRSQKKKDQDMLDIENLLKRL